ncbi:GPI mannosyltransferase 2 [Oopsacas minuta]|uniref:GPI mannosyltransferase 2 n=1 Tax=Oopsacas minuta TaxID=111878 RepID=A0AAV7J9H5_9METZ|nr:GPI mannosyltransferase 2 [Oopsacas minuta]
MHIQVMTRFIFSSTPLVYWYAAREIHKCIDIDAYTDFRSLFSSIARLIKGYPSRRGVTSSTLGSRCILVYFLAYTLAGIVLFPNFLPWT